MKWFAILLMIANVALYLWMSGQQDPGGRSDLPAKPEVNRSGMLLLSEIQRRDAGQTVGGEQMSIAVETIPQPAAEIPKQEEKGALVVDSGQKEVDLPAEQPAATAKADNSETADSGKEVMPTTASVSAPLQPPAIPPAPEPEPESKTKPEMDCYRVGPFNERLRLKAVSDALKGEGISFRVVQAQGRELKATRVYLGPFPGQSKADEMVAKVKSMGRDAYKYRGSDGQQRVQLGYFTQEELARKYVVVLTEQGVQAKTELEFKMLDPLDWLEIRVPSNHAEALKARDWGSQAVELNAVACPN